jgi:hypothetical protein
MVASHLGSTRLLTLLAALCLVAGLRPAAAAEPAVTLSAVNLDDEQPRPKVNGRVDEPAWARVEPYTQFTQQEPNEGAPASERTEVRVLVDRATLYIGIIAFDSDPQGVLVTQSKRDGDLNETDSVQVLLDTFNDNQNGFVFGTNPLGIEYDGQVAAEGQTGGFSARAGSSGSQRGQISGFNANWDGDWTVRAQITERGWETEMAIPLRTLRYTPGKSETWGFNVMRNIRRKNEQVFLAPIPRGYNLYRVSLAAKLTGLDLPARRDIKVTPYATASVNQDKLLPSDQVDSKGTAGVDLKWGVRPSLTADFTVNTDFAQVEADEEQINLTRFPLFFPEKRPFFLENASTFQFGTPQEIDLFFSRRIGLDRSGLPIGIHAGARLSGKIGAYNLGILNMQTEETVNDRTGQLIAPTNNFAVARLQREVGRSNFGAIFVNRQGVGEAAGAGNSNRAYGVDAAIQLAENVKLFTFLAGSTSPGAQGSDFAGRALTSYSGNLWNGSIGYSQVGDRFNPEVGFLPRRGYRKPEGRFFLNYQPKRYPWIRRFSPHVAVSAYYGLDGELQTSRGHWHFFEIQPASGGRFGFRLDRQQDRPERLFPVYVGPDGTRVVIPPKLYSWNEWTAEYFGNPSAPFYVNLLYTFGGFYDGDRQSVDLTVGARAGAKFLVSVGAKRDWIDLPGGSFSTTLVPVKVSYAFTPLASVSALIQYNSQTAQVSSNIRLALLNRSGTGFFVVYNDRRDTSMFTREELLGRSFIVKYTRLFDL